MATQRSIPAMVGDGLRQAAVLVMVFGLGNGWAPTGRIIAVAALLFLAGCLLETRAQ